MGSDDFINLDPSSDSEHQREGNVLYESYSVPDESEGGVSGGNNVHKIGENDETEEGEHEQDMDLESDSEQDQAIVDSGVMVGMLNEFQPEKAPDDASTFLTSDTNANNRLIEEGSVAGVKRARMTYADQQPCVRIVYNFLTRESKRKLVELMQQWSEWHAQCKSSSALYSKEALENGEETYFPALHVGSEKTSVSFWVDSQASNADITSSQVDSESVPLYDRGYTLGSTSLGGSAGSKRMETLEAARCFNCGSYSHSLKECTKPRDNAAINNARKQHNSKRKSTASRGSLRYYQKSQGKFDDLKAGVLGPETRESLGIGELDPPPWLHRMRELGYPPGYLDNVNEDQPSGITIFGEEETNAEFEDGELPEKGDPVPPEKKKTVEFPGINAPIPDKADHRRWAAATPSSSYRNRAHHQRPVRTVDHRRNDVPHIGNESPAGMEYGSSSGAAAAVHSYSPRYNSPYEQSPYEHSNSPHAARSPHLGRSLSDRGWQNPAASDGLPVAQSPRSAYPNYNPSGSWQSPSHPYASSPSASFDRWAPEMPPQQQAGKERHDHYYGHHQRHHRN